MLLLHCPILPEGVLFRARSPFPSSHAPLAPLPEPRALFTVALPLARPTPRPRVAFARNIGAFLYPY